MVTAPPKPPQGSKPWHKYQGKTGNWKLLEPGWAGNLDDDELAFIFKHLEKDTDLRKWWGMKPSWKRIPEEVVKRVAMEGDPDDQALNRGLARPRKQPRAAA
ncbi:MAG TPA: hypothetical protein VFA32_23385 [Dehalococcoidia bacterium]|jgi:hypothetical protein|nr:hypothetical protein [Dehalococcoidia bacterium]